MANPPPNIREYQPEEDHINGIVSICSGYALLDIRATAQPTFKFRSKTQAQKKHRNIEEMNRFSASLSSPGKHNVFGPNRGLEVTNNNKTRQAAIGLHMYQIAVVYQSGT